MRTLIRPAALTALILTLLLAGVVFASSGGGYTLNWWVWTVAVGTAAPPATSLTAAADSPTLQGSPAAVTTCAAVSGPASSAGRTPNQPRFICR